MRRLTKEEVPNTRLGFILKWRSDETFRRRAYNMGFNVVMGHVLFPNGMIADKFVR